MRKSLLRSEWFLIFEDVEVTCQIQVGNDYADGIVFNAKAVSVFTERVHDCPLEIHNQDCRSMRNDNL